MAILSDTTISANTLVRNRLANGDGYAHYEAKVNGDGVVKPIYYPIDTNTLPEDKAKLYSDIVALSKLLAEKRREFQDSPDWSMLYIAAIGAVSEGREVKVFDGFGKLSVASVPTEPKKSAPKGALQFKTAATAKPTPALETFRLAKSGK